MFSKKNRTNENFSHRPCLTLTSSDHQATGHKTTLSLTNGAADIKLCYRPSHTIISDAATQWRYWYSVRLVIDRFDSRSGTAGVLKQKP